MTKRDVTGKSGSYERLRHPRIITRNFSPLLTRMQSPDQNLPHVINRDEPVPGSSGVTNLPPLNYGNRRFSTRRFPRNNDIQNLTNSEVNNQTSFNTSGLNGNDESHNDDTQAPISQRRGTFPATYRSTDSTASIDHTTASVPATYRSTDSTTSIDYTKSYIPATYRSTDSTASIDYTKAYIPAHYEPPVKEPSLVHPNGQEDVSTSIKPKITSWRFDVCPESEATSTQNDNWEPLYEGNFSAKNEDSNGPQSSEQELIIERHIQHPIVQTIASSSIEENNTIINSELTNTLKLKKRKLRKPSFLFIFCICFVLSFLFFK